MSFANNAISVGTLVLATLLTASPSTLNRPLCVNSFTTTPAEIQAEFERQTTGAPWKDVSFTPLERLRAVEEKAWADGVPAATAVTLRRIWTEGGTLYKERANGIIGEPPVMSLEEVIKNQIGGNASL